MRTRVIVTGAGLPAVFALGAVLTVRGRPVDPVERPLNDPAQVTQREATAAEQERAPLPFPPLPSRALPGPVQPGQNLEAVLPTQPLPSKQTPLDVRPAESRPGEG